MTHDSPLPVNRQAIPAPKPVSDVSARVGSVAAPNPPNPLKNNNCSGVAPAAGGNTNTSLNVTSAGLPLSSVGAMLNETVGVINRYMALPPLAAEGIALWITFTHTFSAHEFSPRLAILSPVPECGKTTLMKILGHLCPRSILISNISPAATYRITNEFEPDEPPTLLLDEGGTYLENNEAFRGILNSGHSKDGATVIRSGGKEDKYKSERHSTWNPIAIAKIGRLPPEWASRSIIIHLKRKRREEQKARWRIGDVPELEAIAARMAKWAAPALKKLKDPDPFMPEMLNNRAADNWRPLFAIADMAGGRWGEISRTAALALSGNEDAAPGEILLAAIHAAFVTEKKERFSSEQLCKALKFGDYEQFRSIGQTQLANKLRPFDISSRSVRIDGKPIKGYKLEQFEDAFARYLLIPPGQAATPLQIEKAQ
jgi:Protein of unknown function (DUF3631)